ncbi:MAG: metalloregulator ArsR/SmtB family transcription factor [Firmicutes bacterium]|nr:metalloregulator ArsR/SmtB family transcription factor [Bacillota bacterium]
MDLNQTGTNELHILIKEYVPSNGVLADMCAFFSVFSDITRVKILTALLISELCVTDIAESLNLNQTTVSHQLKLLRDAGMVKFRRNGKIIYYRASNKYIEDAMSVGAKHIGL